MPKPDRVKLNEKLLAAAKSGDVAAALSLIEQGAELDTRNSDGQNALHIAAIHGRTDMIVALIGLGATPNTIDNITWTPLHWAADRGHADAAAILLENGAKLNTHTITGKTPLDLAKFSKGGQTARSIYEFISKRHAERLKQRYIATRHHRIPNQSETRPNLRTPTPFSQRHD